MKNAAPQTILLKEYTVPEFMIDSTELRFELFEDHALVHSKLKFSRNAASKNLKAPLELNGEKLELQSLSLNGKKLGANEFVVTDEWLKIGNVPDAFTLECITKIKPQENLTLEGLYKSTGMFCTQCEAQGFRKITYYSDRPDVMTVFTTTIEADKKKYPILLSNGNCLSKKDLGNGRHQATWNDPFKKPAYLFALVAGDLGMISDHFITRSGRKVALEIYVDKGNEDRCPHAMESLKRSMKWDEERFGLEYDLDIFMIVAVNDFNFGAMENKGLNIFNSNYVLAKPTTATDGDYEGIEAVVGHEYFHNWTGNRVTCRDWFQLSLKEGLTVYRDQEFTSDLMSRSVKRVDDVNHLRNFQFAEDAGPMAHPIRPESYIEINNFYTMTVYEKGAEVIRMIATMIGRDAFRKGIDTYFKLYDGQAVTTEDFVHAMELASGADLTQFRNTWYSQAGTPSLQIRSEYDSSSKIYHFHLEQSCAPTPKQEHKQPYHIPFAMALLDGKGKELSAKLLHLKKAKESFTFENIAEKPVPSLLRDFSAPVNVHYPYTNEELLFLLRHDQNSFARWEAGQKLATRTLEALMASVKSGAKLEVPDSFVAVYGEIARDNKLDPAFRAQLLELPEESYLSQSQAEIDPDAIFQAREFLNKRIAEVNEKDFINVYNSLNVKEEYKYNAEAVGRRGLKNYCLQALASLDNPAYSKLAYDQMRSARNMTDEIAALGALVHSDSAERKQALAEFYKKWSGETLVMNKWLGLQAVSKLPNCLERVKQLMNDPVFTINNPNKVSALLGSFGRLNQVQFHAKDGSAYAFFADLVVDIDSRNPSVSSRLVSLFNQWKRYDVNRRNLAKAQLERIKAKSGLSPGVFEIVTKALE